MEFAVFGGVPRAAIDEVLAIARRRTFRRGEVVFHADDPADALHLVRRGRFAVRVMTPRGDVAIVGVVGAGGSFGEMALIASERAPRSATVEALEAGETLCVAASEFHRLKARHPQVSDAVAALLADRLRQVDRALLIAHYLDAEARIRTALLDLEAIYGDGGGWFELPLTQQQIAELSGTARATVNRVLREEEGRGTLALGRGRTVVLDPAAIRKRVRGLP